MMKDEFEQLLGRAIDQPEYKIIEDVYTWHPAFHHESATARRQVVILYRLCGIGVFHAMAREAEMVKEMQIRAKDYMAQIAEIEGRLNTMKNSEQEIKERWKLPGGTDG